MREGYKVTELGEIPEDWEVVNLDFVIQEDRGITYGIVQPGPFDDKGRYLVRGKDYSRGWAKPEDFFKVSDKVEEPYKRARLKENDLITTIVGAGVGNIEIVPKWLEGANITQTTARIAIDSKKGHYQYYYQVLCSQIGKQNVRNFEKGGAQPGLNLGDIKKYIVPFPSLIEQQKIGEILTTVDEKIEVINAKIIQTQTLKKGLMQQLLTKGIGHTKFKDSELGMVPESWEVVELEKIAKISSGGTPAREKHEYWNGDIPWVTTSLINFNTIVNAKEYITQSGLNNSSAKVFPINTILIAMYGQGLTRGRVSLLGIEATTNQACAALLLNEKKIDKYYIFYILQSNYENLRKLSNDGSQKNLSGGLLKSFKIQLPPKEEQEKIAFILNTVDDKLGVLQAKRENFMTLKKGLMQQLLTGKIRVKI